jgi:hypothetical protein
VNAIVVGGDWVNRVLKLSLIGLLGLGGVGAASQAAANAPGTDAEAVLRDVVLPERATDSYPLRQHG